TDSPPRIVVPFLSFVVLRRPPCTILFPYTTLFRSVGTCYTRAEMKDGFMPHTIKKMSLIGLILMIFTSVFGFANSPSAYYLMGYSAIPFYIFSALLF